MSRLARRFASLRWRLTLSFAAVTLVALLALEVAFVVVPGLVAARSPQRPISLVQNLEHLSPQVAPYLEKSPPDRAGLTTWLAAYGGPLTITEGITDNLRSNIAIVPGQNATLVVTDATGQVLASHGSASPRTASLSSIQAAPETRAVVAAALRNQTNLADLVLSTQSGTTVAATPITDSAGHVIGALLLGVDLRAQVTDAFIAGLVGLLLSLILFTVLASVMGTLFGLLTARGLIRRLGRLTAAADAWSRGDFAVSVRDPSHDELGQLARDLNRMAEQLRTLLATRRELAVVDERNRLARDLHDSVKQQIFATSMQVSAARELVRRDPDAAEARLNDVERMVGEAQRELTALIRELRPAALDSKGLARALREYCDAWSRRTGVATEVRIQGDQPAPMDVEQALFRVAQEALANVARHSGATHAEVQLSWEHGALLLSVTDNGKGFDVAAADGAGVGLQSMRERVEAHGGALSVGRATTGSGTYVEACVPLARLPILTPDIGDSSLNVDRE